VNRAFRVGLMAALAAVAGLPLFLAPGAAAEDAPTPQDKVIAIVSPLSAPACGTAGSFTLLVPILGSVVEGKLPFEPPVNVGNTVLDALGPLFIVCGSIPGKVGSRCELDDTILGQWPEQLRSLLPPPAVIGAAVDALGATGAAANLPDDATGAGTVLSCYVPQFATAPPPPPPRARPAPLPTFADNVALPNIEQALAPLGTPAIDPTQGTHAPRTRIVSVTTPFSVSGFVRFLQAALALLLASALSASWITSLRARRGSR
jgi:hypothetical protein